MFSSKAVAIRDPEVAEFIKTFPWNSNSLHSPVNFVKKHRQWLLNNSFYVEGLDRFKYGYITAGCTEAFNEVYREPCYVLKGEYTYHRDSRRAIETTLHNIPFGSRLIISYPFAETGNPHEDWDHIIDYCTTKNIRIFVDACLSSVSIGKLDLRNPIITHVAFSFSKAFGTGHMRTGVVYSNQLESPASVTNKHLYLNHMNIDLHMKLMEHYTSDYVFKKYRLKQLDLCKKHSLIQSDCVLYGLDNNERKCVSPYLGTLQPFQI